MDKAEWLANRQAEADARKHPGLTTSSGIEAIMARISAEVSADAEQRLKEKSIK